MFGFGWPEFTVLLVIGLVGLSIRSISTGRTSNVLSSNRKCLACGFEGPMKTWLANHSAPQFITLVLLLFWVLPGLIFIAWAWGKHKCPRCGAVGKNMLTSITPAGTNLVSDEKICPYCAETIKSAAVICKHCQKELPVT